MLFIIFSLLICPITASGNDTVQIVLDEPMPPDRSGVLRAAIADITANDLQNVPQLFRALEAGIERHEEIVRLERKANSDWKYCLFLGLVGGGMILTGLTFPSDSSTYSWLTIPGFFIAATGGIAGGSFLFRKCQICCLRFGPRSLL